MSKYRKFAIFFILTETIILIGFNIWAIRNSGNSDDKKYRVDIGRVATRIENGEDCSNINLKDYETIVEVGKFDASAVYRNEYAVKLINGALYCFEYTEDNDYTLIKLCDLIMIALIVCNIILLIYLDRKMIIPFKKMDNLTVELAKGNLATPIQQEKSKYFGRFLWGMDMLRETLEDNKKRELELLKEKKTLVLSLSHDIKTPLSAIDLYVKALRRNLYDSEEERNSAFDGIEHNVGEIKRYVQEISQVSREDFLTLEVNNTELYLLPIINKVLAYYNEKMQRLHIDFSIAQVDECLIYGDEDRIIEVLQNTIENAIKYGDGTEITISFEEEENCKLITVSNSGCDLSEDELPHIFDSFYRGSNSEKEDGSGLGLYICKELMHRMDGEVFAKICGNEFRVTIVVRKL